MGTGHCPAVRFGVPRNAYRTLMSLLARTSIVSAATLASRVLGFARDAAIAAVLGAGPRADALMAALSLPLLARRLLAEGAFNLAFVPALFRARARGDGAAPGQLAAAVAVLLGGLLVVAGALGIVFMAPLIGLLAPGFEADGARAETAIACGRIALAYLPLAGLAAVFGGLANAAHRVLLPALAPVVANLTVLAVIAALVLSGEMDGTAAVYAIAAATVAAGVAQLALMMLAARGSGLWPAWQVPRGAPAWRAAGSVLRAAAPALLFAGLSQFRLLMAAALVSGAPGAVAALNYAQRLMDLPLGLVGASAGAVLVPALLRGGSGKDASASGALLAALAFALPAAVGLFVLAEPIVAVLFQRGSFSAEDSRMTAELLALLALSLPLQGLERILSATAAAAGLLAGAERVALLSLAVCLGGGAALGVLYGPAGATAGIAVSAAVSVGLLATLLARHGHLALEGRVVRVALGLAGAAALMGLGVTAAAQAWPAGPHGGIAAAPRLAVLVAAGMGIYGAAALLARRLA